MFVSLEGIDGSGKSTQAALLAEAMGSDAVLVREPGGTPAGETIRDLLKSPSVALSPLTELLLFCAARAELTEQVIRPALDSGRDVVSDRFVDSTVAYQGIARGLGAGLAAELSASATSGLVPDLTLLIRIDPELAAGRLRRGDDRFEGEGIELQRAVAAAYEGIAAADPGRIVVIDGSGAIEQVHAAVTEAVEQRAASAGRSPG